MCAPSNKSISQPQGFTIKGLAFSAPKLPAALYLVATPIGNLGDITIRALETLAGCDVIACEDTRTSGVLLKRYGIDRPKVSYTEHNATTRGPNLLRQINEGKAVALISDAGTPLVSDPGFRLVQEAIEGDIAVIPIPGASAPVAALVASGLISEKFQFCGFLPVKSQARTEFLKQLSTEPSTQMFFESPARLVASLKAMVAELGGDRQAVVARELTKMHETFHRGRLADLVEEFELMDKVRGEIVLVVAGAEEKVLAKADVEDLLRTALQALKTKDAVRSVADATGLSKQQLYKQALALKPLDQDDG